jgi:hypothetical protein
MMAKINAGSRGNRRLQRSRELGPGNAETGGATSSAYSSGWTDVAAVVISFLQETIGFG